jgi:hypothetical protein
MIDNRAPMIPEAFNTKGCKKFRMEEERLDQIKKNNRFLLKKMMGIEMIGTPISPSKILIPQGPSAYSLN